MDMNMDKNMNIDMNRGMDMDIGRLGWRISNVGKN